MWQITFFFSFLQQLSLVSREGGGVLGGVSRRKYVDMLVFTEFESAGVALNCSRVSAGGLKSTADES